MSQQILDSEDFEKEVIEMKSENLSRFIYTIFSLTKDLLLPIK